MILANMQKNRALWLVVGSFVVACSTPAVEAVVRDSGLLDSFTADDVLVSDTTSPAEAGPTSPTVDAVMCDKTYPCGATGTSTCWYGEKTYPGRTKADLSRASIFVCGAGSTAVPGYNCWVSGNLGVRDGAVAIDCGFSTSKPTMTFTIVMPPPS